MYDNNVELTPTQVSKVLNVTRGHSTRLIYKLQSKGLVELAIGDFDKRNRLLSLSEAGRKFVTSIAKDHGDSLFRNFQRDDSPDTGQEDVALHPDGAVSSTPTEDVVGRSDRPENGEDAGELHEAETDPSKLFPTELDFIRPKGNQIVAVTMLHMFQWPKSTPKYIKERESIQLSNKPKGDVHDNLNKIVLDAMEDAELIDNDKQIIICLSAKARGERSGTFVTFFSHEGDVKYY